MREAEPNFGQSARNLIARLADPAYQPHEVAQQFLAGMWNAGVARGEGRAQERAAQRRAQAEIGERERVGGGAVALPPAHPSKRVGKAYEERVAELEAEERAALEDANLRAEHPPASPSGGAIDSFNEWGKRLRELEQQLAEQGRELHEWRTGATSQDYLGEFPMEPKPRTEFDPEPLAAAKPKPKPGDPDWVPEPITLEVNKDQERVMDELEARLERGEKIIPQTGSAVRSAPLPQRIARAQGEYMEKVFGTADGHNRVAAEKAQAAAERRAAVLDTNALVREVLAERGEDGSAEA